MVKLCDCNNNDLGSVLRSDVRKNNLWHRASYIFIRKSNGKFVIQVRADTKDYCPGFFDLVTGGVVGGGEDDDISAARELEEELGIRLQQPMTKVACVPFENDSNRVWMNLYLI